METWILITLVSAFLQNIRSSLQKHLKSVMGTAGATFVRFGFGIPFALIFLFLFTKFGNHELPSLNSDFVFWVVIAGIAQIIAQALLVHMFSLRNFTVGSAYSRTEPMQAALFGLLFLSEKISTAVLGAITISVFGVMLISVARITITPRSIITALFTKTALIGLSSGAIFGIAAVAYRAASLALEGPNYIIQASVTLSFAIIMQSIILMVWIYVKDRAEIARIRAAWKTGLLVGLFGASASFGWFMAMTLQQSALVKAVAQVEMLFAFATSIFIFKEDINKYEILGCGLIVCGILALVLGS
jgi:drug/metabolite transporter (DMT)-like permease